MTEPLLDLTTRFIVDLLQFSGDSALLFEKLLNMADLPFRLRYVRTRYRNEDDMGGIPSTQAGNLQASFYSVGQTVPSTSACTMVRGRSWKAWSPVLPFR